MSDGNSTRDAADVAVIIEATLKPILELEHSSLERMLDQQDRVIAIMDNLARNIEELVKVMRE